MNTSAAKNRRIRIALLELLKTEYPGPLDLRALQFSLDNLGYPMPEAMLEAHLSYLAEKGFVAIDKREGRGYHIAFATLTALGWDLIDGLESDKGIDEVL